MINVLEPQHELLKRFVDSFYVLRKGMAPFEFTVYPTTNTAVGLFRNATVAVKNDQVLIDRTGKQNFLAMACNQFSNSVHLRYQQTTDEIAINFKTLGFSSFTGSKPKDETIFRFHQWDQRLPQLFDRVFATTDPKQQLACIEQFLAAQHQPLDDEPILIQALCLLNDATKEYKMEEIAAIVGMHYKQLYRSFTENIGCSPAHYRKLVRFRSSVVSKIREGGNKRLVDICYDHDYTDQPYFIRQFKELTGERPTLFFKKIRSFGNNKVIFKID